jgi:ribosomal protein L16/L10AE
MLKLPRRLRWRLVQKRRGTEQWRVGLTGDLNWTLVIGRRCKLFWRHFETVRLQLIWGIIRGKRLSRKARFKRKAKVKLSPGKFKRVSRAKRGSRYFWYCGFPHLPLVISKHGRRMGKGKGSLHSWFFCGHAGVVFLQVGGLHMARLRYILFRLSIRLPGKMFIPNYDFNKSINSFNFKRGYVKSWWRGSKCILI